MFLTQTEFPNKSGSPALGLSNPRLRLLLLDDHVLARQAVRALLTEPADAKVFDGPTKDQAVELFRQCSPDIVLLNYTFGESSVLGLIEKFIEIRPSVKVLVLSLRSEATYASRSMMAGARGYISKSASAEELVKALSTIARGEIYLEPDIATKLALRRVRGVADVSDKLTVRELEILRLISEGKDLSSIGRTFNLAYKSVANIVSQLKTKLKAKCMSELVKIAYELHND